MQRRHAAHVPIRIIAKTIGKSVIWHTRTTNCPATLQTATASLNLLQQQIIKSNNKPEIPKQIYP